MIYEARQLPKEALFNPTTSIIRDWATAVVNGNPSGETRARVLKAFNNVHKELRGHDLASNSQAVLSFATRHELKEALPLLRTALQKLPEQPTSEQLELIGFAALTFLTTHELATPDSYNISLDLTPFGVRLYNAKAINSEDWLQTLSMVVWHKGSQMEARIKKKVRDTNLQYLVDNHTHTITLKDIEAMHTRVISAVYPRAHTIQTFRDTENMFDADARFIVDPKLHIYASTNDAEGRKRMLDRYFDNYNTKVALPSSNPEKDAAMLYMMYVTIHPHLDGNGTMSKTMVDYYLVKNNLPRIDWDSIKTDKGVQEAFYYAFEDYLYLGKKKPLETWFDQQITSR